MVSAARRSEMVEVELVDVDQASASPAAGSPERARLADAPVAGARTGTPGHHLRRGAALVMIAGLGVTTLAVIRVDGDEQVLLGASPTLSTPLSATWRVEAREGWSVVHGLLLTPERTSDGIEVTAYDMSDGTARWSLPPSDAVSTVQCPVGVDGPDGPLVVCQALGHLVPAGDPEGGITQDPGRLYLLDAATGTVEEELRLLPAHRGFGGIDGDLVIATARPGEVEVVRRDAAGEVVWSTGVPLDGDTGGGPPAHVDVTDGAVLVSGSVTTLVAHDGAVLGSWGRVPNSPSTATWPALSSSPLGVGVRVDQTERRAPTSWFTPDGHLLGAFAGASAEPTVSDGSVPEVLLALTPGWGTLRALDLAEDRTRWTEELDRARPVLRSGGGLLVAGDGVVRSLDLATGAERWRVEPEGVTRVHPVSDGSFVLATGRTRGRAPSLTALSLSDGSVVWRTPMPAGTTSVAVHDGQMLAFGAGVVVGLG